MRETTRVCVRVCVRGCTVQNRKKIRRNAKKKKKKIVIASIRPSLYISRLLLRAPPSAPSLLASIIQLLCFSTFCSSASSPAPSSLISISLFFFSLSLSVSLFFSFCLSLSLSLSLFFDLSFFFSVASCVSSLPPTISTFFSTIPFICYPSSSSTSLFDLIILLGLYSLLTTNYLELFMLYV